jgi:predicted transcriptional regulator
MADFILSRLKENFGSDEEEEESGFDDMNYIIGQSSAMDMGEFPTPMDERIGMAAMTGGELMELQITNPATFTMERDKMVSVIDQLGLDVTLHPDMNAGFTSPQLSGRGEQYGYETVEDYFTEYIQELAAFKKHVEDLGEGGSPLFKIGRMNPHIATTPLPSISERMANDVGVDPFGFNLSDYDEDSRNLRRRLSKDIWANEKFLKKFYETFLVSIVDQRWQLFTGRQGLFTQYSDKFDRIYRDTMRRACDKFYKDVKNNSDNKLQDIISLVSTAGRADVGVQNAWLNKIDQEFDEGLEDVEGPIETLEVQEEELMQGLIFQLADETDNPEEIAAGLARRYVNEVQEYNVSRLSDLNEYLPQMVRVTRISSLPEAVYNIENQNFSEPRGLRSIARSISQSADVNFNIFIDSTRIKNEQRLANIAKKQIEDSLDDIWKGNNGKEENKFLITVQGKLQSLANNKDIERARIRNAALEEKGVDWKEGDEWDKIDNAAKAALANQGEFFEDDEVLYHQFLEALLSQFGRQMWKESSLLYYIIPAWMSEADNTPEGHEGWKAPKFIWKALVEDKYDFELSDPEGEEGYLEMLKINNEFRMDVAAASAACYVWGHFTQRKNIFDLKGRDFDLDEDEEEDVQNEGWTWIDWMNRFGLGVNFETMQGSPQQKFKIWRPKDIAVAAHAVNMTARKRAEDGDLGGMDHVHEELDGRPAKFTVDMEHTATMGAPPFHEMELFRDQEEDLADEWDELGIDEDKPIAKILRQIHLMDPGVEAQRGTYHGAIERGNTLLYEWLYNFVDWGFARNEEEAATVLFELAEHQAESVYMMRIMMDLIELGIEPDDLDPSVVDPSTEPEDEEEALIGRFYGIERENYTREWAKIEEHAFDPLQGLLEAEPFDYTFSSNAATQQGENRPNEWQPEEYR